MAWLERRQPKLSYTAFAGAVAMGTVLFGGILAAIQVPPLQLSGGRVVPIVQTTSTASSTIEILADSYVGGAIETAGVQGTTAHLHVGAPGINGPAIITLEQQGNNRWAVPAGAHLSQQQYADFRAGKLYVDVHSAAHPGGELRLQLVGSGS
jgi:hypothetical protein